MKLLITLTEPMLGTTPKNPEVYKEFIESKKPENIAEEEYRTVEQIEKSGWNGFHSDENGLFVYDYLFKGFIKEAGNVMKEIVKIKGLRNKINNYLFVFPRRIYLGKKEPDSVIERSVVCQTAQGQRITVKRSDAVNAGTQFNVELMLLQHKELSEDIVLTLLGYGALKGLGEWRNGSYGRFNFEVLP